MCPVLQSMIMNRQPADNHLVSFRPAFELHHLFTCKQRTGCEKSDCRTEDCLCHFDLQFVDSTLPLRGGAGRLHLIECSSGHEFEQLSDYRS
jgi:hypothetical protein